MSEWVKLSGGSCPVRDDAMVEVMFRNGTISTRNFAGEWDWARVGFGSDIVAYRLADPIRVTREEAYEDAAKPISDNALNEQVGGSHYLQFEIQPIEFINANKLDFLSGNVVKYISRHRMKGGAEDVNKAIHYCKLILEMQYGEDK